MKLFRIRIWIILLASSLCINFQSSAQSVNQSQRSFKRSAATVIFSSLGGGILGLSTLSFYGKPQEHTDNITTGVALGLLAGMVYIFSDTESRALNEVKNPWIPEFYSQKTKLQQSETVPSLSMNIDF